MGGALTGVHVRVPLHICGAEDNCLGVSSLLPYSPYIETVSLVYALCCIRGLLASQFSHLSVSPVSTAVLGL